MAAIAGGLIEVSEDSGATWSSSSDLSDQTWSSVACSKSASNIIAVTTDGGVYYSKNTGSSWKQSSLDSTTTESFLSVDMSR